MEYLKVSEIAKKWGLSTRRVRLLCAQGRIAGVVRKGNLYFIPSDAPQPTDARTYAKRKNWQPYTPLLEQIDEYKHRLSLLRPLTPAETEALRDVFLVEHTYNSNAIEGNTLTLQETALVLQGITIDQKPLKDHLEVVGYKEAVLRNDLTSAAASEMHDGVLQRAVVDAVDLVRGEAAAGFGQRLAVYLLQQGQKPHSFIGPGA